MNERLPKKITRRAFLSSSAKVALGVAGVLLSSAGMIYYGASRVKERQRHAPPKVAGMPGNIVKVGESVTLNAIQGFEKIKYTATIQDAWVATAKRGFVYVTRSAQGELLILSPSCTHLGCNVEPLKEPPPAGKKELYFLCPCHGAEFDKSGNAIGVVTQGLDTYEPILSGGFVYIDIASPLKRV
ncbi:ubiquinol-cytochrome c reductase iron-sulfur subunit [Cohnella lupini]|uniref:Rieske Fe-S protein n=1 Tax=Cohnella lupini TaxID=1294267 RepID=A0A3D9INE6_9BACL|nr:Rieske (2Fe-2S) protein [Cohnella lupini]RED63238.1 Rieske Fe-S protein [Cohnella lupini]